MGNSQEIDYGFMFHLISSDIDPTPLEDFFQRMELDFKAYENQVRMTMQLYNTEEARTWQKIEEDHNASLAEANKRYEEIFATTTGDDRTKHQWASHESGLDRLEYDIRDLQEPILNSFNGMA